MDYAVAPNRAIRLLTGSRKIANRQTRILVHPEPEVRLDEALAMGRNMKYDSLFYLQVSPKESRHLVPEGLWNTWPRQVLLQQSEGSYLHE